MAQRENLTAGADARADRLRGRVAELEAELETARAEQALHRAILENVPDFVLKISPDGTIQFINRIAPGIDGSSVVGSSSYDFIDPGHREVARLAIARVCETKLPTSYETVGDGPYGRKSRYLTRLSPLLHGGEVESLVMIATDVTAMLETQAALHESAEKLALAVESTGVGMWSWQSDTGVISWDPATCRIFGRSAPPASYAEYLECIHPDDRAQVDALLQRAIAAGVYDDIEHRVLMPDGQVHWVMCKGRVIASGNGVTRLLGGALDVTQRHELREQLLQAQKMDAVGQLAAGIAHNFNNMLTVMLSSMELAARRSAGDAAALLGEGQAAALRAAKMVRQLMLFSGKKQKLEWRVEDVTEVARRTVEMCRTTFDREIALELLLGTGVPPVRGDASQLEQALLNVLINARDAVEGVERGDRRIRVEISRKLAADGSVWVEIGVRDNGVGMSAETKSRAFEPFFTTKETGRGTGLGLATTYAIIKDHGGRLEIESAPGVGTLVVIALPCVTAPAELALETSQAPSSRGSGERLLVVDDEALVRDVVSRLLSEAGYQVDVAADGVEALEILRAHRARYALVLLDQSMPKLSGKSTLKEIRELEPELGVICFSGYPSSLEGADAVLEKPVRGDTLLEAIQSVIAARAPRA